MSRIQCSALWSSRLLLVCYFTGLRLASSAQGHAKYIIVSAPRLGRVNYARIHHGVGAGNRTLGEVQTLIDTGLVNPQGIAVDQLNHRLIVADPASKRILAYPLHAKRKHLVVGQQEVRADGMEVRWVAVDGVGNIIFSDEPSNRILRLQATADAEPEVLHDGAALAQVRAPGGVAVDSLGTYWVNKQIGTQVGSLVRDGELSSLARGLRSATTVPGVGGGAVGDVGGVSLITLARNSEKSYGVCVTGNNVFYTQPERTLFVAKKTGNSEAKAVSNELVRPRGCVWDGDGTVYVADRGASAVYSFAGNMMELGATSLTHEGAFQDAFGVAVYSKASERMQLAKGTLLAFGAVLLLAV